FQAEDGIRDFHVTGVQTCALPICFPHPLLVDLPFETDQSLVELAAQEAEPGLSGEEEFRSEFPAAFDGPARKRGGLEHLTELAEIGRASCRERVYREAGAIRWIRD